MGGRVTRSGPVAGTGVQENSVTVVGPFVATMQPDRLLAGDLLAGRYQIEAAIGCGASGRVLRAFDRETRAVVAVKILRPELVNDSTWVDRLSRELRVGRQIQHPNLCRVFDVGEADGFRFLTMEIAPGGTLGQEIRRRGGDEPPVPFMARVADARAIIQGVAALHAAGIIHRDIKPDNILRMADGRLVVSDFGLATDPGVGPTCSILVGTPSYMAPEVAMGESGSARADIFSLGIVLHEFLFGSRPEWTALAGSGERKVAVSRPRHPIEAAVADLCAQCLSPSPALRPSSAEALLATFDAAIAGRRRRPARRRKAATFVWGTVILLSLCVLGVSRNRWWSRASASLFAGRVTKPSAVLVPAGAPVDFTRGAQTLATFAGRISCYALLAPQRAIRVIWGYPRRAEELDLDSGRRQPANLLPETFADGCPEVSPDGRNLLFVRSEDTGTYVFMGAGLDGSNARKIVRGSRPRWLPSGDEFLFDLDSHHPAVFSLPTGEMTVIGEGVTGTRQLAETAVDPSGRYIALRYFDDANNNRIVIESQETFESQASFVVPSSAFRLGFVGPDHKLVFTLYGTDGSAELIEADWQRGALRRVGKIPGADVLGMLDTPGGVVVLSRKLRLNAWLDAPQRPLQLTRDGTSDGGAMSVRGDLLIQRFLDDRRYVIALRTAEGRERLLTKGPIDMSPSFFADADRWVYANYQTQQIFACRLSTGGCASLHLDASTPAWPTVDPFGSERIAYVTLLNASRLRVLSLATGVARDLGPVMNDCPPVWVPGGHLWAMQSARPETTWAEFDVASGLRTGETISRPPTPDRLCQLPPRLRAMAERASPRVFAVAEEQSQLLTHPPF